LMTPAPESWGSAAARTPFATIDVVQIEGKRRFPAQSAVRPRRSSVREVQNSNKEEEDKEREAEREDSDPRDRDPRHSNDVAPGRAAPHHKAGTRSCPLFHDLDRSGSMG